MSAALRKKLYEDRAIRDAARTVIKTDISHLKADFAVKNVGVRFATRIKEGSVDVFEEAVTVADDNRGVLTALLAAVFLWFTRNSVMSLFKDEDTDDSETHEAADTIQ